MMQSFSTVTIGVSNFESAMGLWHTAFGFEIVSKHNGADHALARLRGLSATNIKQQALLRTPDQKSGMLHIIEFESPSTPVREGAQSTDYCPKNLDLYVQDMPKQMARLKQQGYAFKTDEYTQMTLPDGTEVKEIHMHGHDAINIVLLEISGREFHFTRHGFSGIGPLVTIVPDYDDEKEFYNSVLNFKVCDEIELSGAHIEKMIGLPAGTILKFGVMGHPDAHLGRIEIIDYYGAAGNDLYSTIDGNSLGILGVSYLTGDLEQLKTHLNKLSIEYDDFGTLELLHVQGDSISFYSPAGLRIDVSQSS